jgi:regulator of protease activity HflC (stomatin/prohibitin superfamily)
LIVAGLLLFLMIVSGGGVTVGANQIGVMINSNSGQITILQPGVHIWPFSSNAPFITSVVTYDLNNQIAAAGMPPEGKTKGDNGLSLAQEYGIQADSNSAGRPIVYFSVQAYVSVNKDKVIDLYRKYGHDYLRNWVNQNVVAAIKAVQGRNPFDYVGNDRAGLQAAVKTELEKMLVNDDKQQLITVSQVLITDWDLSPEMNQYLNEIIAKKNEAQKAAQQVDINTNNQKSAKIQADTDYNNKKRAAEAEAAKLEAEAQGQANAIKLKADADAYAVAAKYQAEADGIKKIQQVLANAPDGYLLYLLYTQWKGDVPDWVTDGSVFPFVNLPTPNK